MAVGVRLLVPLTVESGWPLILSYPLFLWAPLLVLLTGVLIYFRRHRSAGTSFVAQFRLHPIGGKTWLWVIGGFVLVQVAELILAFMPWGYFTLLPVSLILPYLVQRHGSTWIGIIIHGLGNLLVLAVIIPGIAG